MHAGHVEPPEHELPRMSFGDHLEELRRRVVVSLIAVAVCIFGMLPFKREVTEVFTAPYNSMWLDHYAGWRDALFADLEARGGLEALPEIDRKLLAPVVEFHRDFGAAILDGTFPESRFGMILSQGDYQLPRTLKALGGLDDFWTFMAASLLFALILAAPIVLYQAWAFIAAGLYPRERKAVLRYMPLGLGLFTVGVLFGYFLVVPYGLFFLIKLMDWAQVTSMMSVSIYFSFLFTLTSALGVVFQLPLVMLALQKVGIVTHATMRKNWRVVILSCFAISAIMTPPDPVTQCLMAVPMCVLYVIGLLLTARHSGRVPKVART